MPQETNLNVNPYFDDFDKNNNHYKVLFKPGAPVQARELSTLQSILQNQIEQFDDCKQIPLHFVGSIGFYLKDELEKVLKKNDLKLGKVLKRPIEGLVNYHLKNI